MGRKPRTRPAAWTFAWTFVAATVSIACSLPGAASAAEAVTAAGTDPVTLGWMVGTPPPPERAIRFDDGSHYRFPQWRWSFSHWRELLPTANVSRGTRPVVPLPRAERTDLDAVSFVPIGATKPMTWAESLEANFTDGIVVLHRGRIVYEKYFGALDAHRQHAAMSVTKSFVGTLAAMLIAEGKIDASAPVTRYVPELAGSGFDGATVQQVLDMTTALDYSEDYSDPRATFITYARASGSLPTPPEAPRIRSAFEFTRALQANGAHGEAFRYRSPNTDVVGWVVARVTGKRLDAVLEERLWTQMGMESDGAFQVDGAGMPFAPGGLTLVLRDLARFGEMMRLGGRFDGRQIVPATAVAEIRRGADPAKFVGAGYPTLPGWSYHDQWWISHDDHGAFMARGIHGQAIYVDPKAEMVVARFASHPKAGNVAIDPTSLPAYRAVAERLMRGR